MRLLIISNRLPVAVSKESDGTFKAEKSAGGLVSGLSDYLTGLGKNSGPVTEYLWMGWPGLSVKPKHHDQVRQRVRENFNAAPIFLEKELMENVYLGFCNKTIWPLFHYFPQHARFDMHFWADYQKMNEIFCEEILRVLRPDDVIWVHDYHLMLLPGLLREKVTNPIGFFLHIPFPTYEMYRLLPAESRTKVLQGLMGCDLIGFHTHDYSQYFLRCVLRVLGRENHMGRIDMPDHTVEVETFPMGIDYAKFHSMDVSPFRSHKAGPGEPKMVLSVDRLDYSKGIVNRLKGFELFLLRYPEWRGKVYLNMIVVPSRTGVSTYLQIKKRLDELVGRINGQYGSITWTPVIYQYTSLPHKELIAQYRMCDVALLTPLRDGMNLVAKEYIASLTDQKGVLILSEFTGAAKELSEAVIINPNSYDEIADSIAEALDIKGKEQVRGNVIMQKRLKRYTVTKWANDFVRVLLESSERSQYTARKKLLNEDLISLMHKAYRAAKRRIIIVNYDGTLVPYSKYPTHAAPPDALLGILQNIDAQENTDMVIISGRSKDELDSWLATLPVNLTAEHGSWIREAETADWKLFKPLSQEWKKEIIPILEMYSDRLPGAYLHERAYSLAWHYDKADVEQAAKLVTEVNDHLLSITTNINLQVLQGNGVIEVSNSGINKGELAMHWLSKKEYDFVLAMGAGWSDELLFQTLPEHAWSVKVGMSQTDARFVIRKQDDAVRILEKLIQPLS
ncbi:MAG: bifunctional alpha,alpha-trehalose-phosphate synthase (UDP-forming)/trehalose-phosphatase [Bacteroidales bacterium]|nr:bifunctional alpha,alpha-trehalose-phosphate synthase (UDP-forming)/trehalose-phosphatase [Bacteroidales bacterium]